MKKTSKVFLYTPFLLLVLAPFGVLGDYNGFPPSPNVMKSLEYFEHLRKNKYKDPYLYYLLSLNHLKKEEIEDSLKYLKMCVDKDEFYKVIAHNEPDFDPLFENDEFKAIIE